ncbi:MAG: hypothetical protein JW841_13510 [Deltaproteobacteria bacterium]|nr:hypothetical protein [Deltaproteobacteria bacterium]
MLIIKSVCLSIAAILCLVFSVRLLLLSRQTRGTPEFFWGLAWFLGAIVNVFNTLTVAVNTPILNRFFHWGLEISYPMLIISLFIANWRLFRPGRLWAKAINIAVAASLVITWIVEITIFGFAVSLFSTDVSFVVFVCDILITMSFLWAAIEMWYYHRLFKRRALIGLASPFLSIRYLLWFAASIMLLMHWFVLWSRYLVATPYWLNSITLPILLLLSISFMWITFFPPRFLRERYAEDQAQ